MKQSLFVAALLAALTGCSSIPFISPLGTRNPIIDNLKPGVFQHSSLSVGEEKDLARQRGDNLGFVRIKPVDGLLDRIHSRLIAGAGLYEVPGRVKVLANSSLSAHSTPDGNIFVAMSWIVDAESEDELAALVAHELSHVLLGHHSTDIVGQMQKRLHGLKEMSVGVKLAFEKVQEASIKDKKTLQAMQLASMLGDKIIMPAFGRRQEREADLLGVDLLMRAGYNPGAMGNMLKRREAWENENQESEEKFWQRIGAEARKDVGQAMMMTFQRGVDFFSAKHPDTKQRIDDVAEYIGRHYGDKDHPDDSTHLLKWVMSFPIVSVTIHNYKQAFAAKKELDSGGDLQKPAR